MKPVQLLGILLLLAALCGCGGERRDPSDLGEILTEYGNDTAAEKGDWLMLQMPAEMPHLNPLTSSDYYASTVLDWVFDTLLYRDQVTMDLWGVA